MNRSSCSGGGWIRGMALACLMAAPWSRAQEEESTEVIAPLAPDVYVVLEGTIGEGLEVRMMLSRLVPSEDREVFVDGWYFYKSQQKPISLWGTLEGGRLKLDESPAGETYLAEEEVTGHFEGEWVTGSEGDPEPVKFAGTWRSPDGKKQYPFELSEHYAPGITAADYFRFAVRHERERGRETISREVELTFPQFRGETEGIRQANALLRSLAAETKAGVYSDSSAEEGGEKSATVRKPDPVAPSLAEVERGLTTPPIEDEDFHFLGFNQWYYGDVFEILYNERDLACLRIYHDEYTGGAHGNQWDRHVTLDLKTGRSLSLDDLLKPGWREPLRRLAEARLRKDAGLKPDEPLTNGPLFEDKFELNDNWYLSPNGIGFSFVPYEISAYAYGFLRIEIPRESLTEFLAEDSPLLRAVSR